MWTWSRFKTKIRKLLALMWAGHLDTVEDMIKSSQSIIASNKATETLWNSLLVTQITTCTLYSDFTRKQCMNSPFKLLINLAKANRQTQRSIKQQVTKKYMKKVNHRMFGNVMKYYVMAMTAVLIVFRLFVFRVPDTSGQRNWYVWKIF